MADAALRLPAEWEPQAAVVIAWPHAGTDWALRLAEVERSYVALAAAILRFQPLLVCVANATLGERVRALLTTAKADVHRLRLVELAYDDTWLRDSGPITLRAADGHCRLLDLLFTCW
jgi:agmatine/peptidylarginine deiminase